VVAKTKYSVEIIKDGITRSEAMDMEVILIRQYGRRDLGTGSLVNMTEGGEGLNGHIFTEEHKLKISSRNKGRKFSEEARKKMSESAKIKKFSDEHRRNISKSLKGNKHSLGVKHTLETRTKVSQALSKRSFRPSFKGGSHTEASKQKQSKKLKEAWASYSDDQRKERSRYKLMKVVDTSTGRVYDSLQDASKEYGFSSGLLSKYLSGKRKNKTSLVYAR